MGAIPRRSVVARLCVKGLARSRRGDGAQVLALVKQTEPSLRAVRLVIESRDQYDSEWAAINAIATKLGIGSTEIRKLRAENRELRRSNEILWAAAGFFAAALDRPQR